MMSMRPERDNKRDVRREKPKKEFEELLLEVRRVTRVTTGGRRLSFRATILVGNKREKSDLESQREMMLQVLLKKLLMRLIKTCLKFL